jgi:hypothetical protein
MMWRRRVVLMESSKKILSTRIVYGVGGWNINSKNEMWNDIAGIWSYWTCTTRCTIYIINDKIIIIYDTSNTWSTSAVSMKISKNSTEFTVLQSLDRFCSSPIASTVYHYYYYYYYYYLCITYIHYNMSTPL